LVGDAESCSAAMIGLGTAALIRQCRVDMELEPGIENREGLRESARFGSCAPQL